MPAEKAANVPEGDSGSSKKVKDIAIVLNLVKYSN
jgi:hypothetical protein